MRFPHHLIMQCNYLPDISKSERHRLLSLQLSHSCLHNKQLEL